MLPRVVVHNEVSLDGRVTGFDVHMELYYQLASRIGEDAILAGADTILAAPDEVEEETDDDLSAFAAEPEAGRPCLVIPDSRGRVRTWHMLRRWPFWGRFIALVSETTPSEHLEYLRERSIETIIAGDDHVDLRRALEELNGRYGVQVVRTDSGGTLNGVLLGEGLVDELSVLLNASFAGDSDTVPFLRSPPGWTGKYPVLLKLVSVDGMEDDTVHLRYEVVR